MNFFLPSYLVFVLPRLCLLLLRNLFTSLSFFDSSFSFFLLSSLPSIFLLPSSPSFPFPVLFVSFFLFSCFLYSQQILKGGMSKYSCREGVGEIGVYLHAFPSSTLDGGKCSALPPVLQRRSQEFCSEGGGAFNKFSWRQNGDLGEVAP